MDNDLSPERLVGFWRDMVRIRAFERAAVYQSSLGKIYGALHSYEGQESCAVGICGALTAENYVASTHRGHGHSIAKGARMDRMMAELFGRETGYCKGKGGSLHIADFSCGMLGANGIVGASYAIAADAALNAKVTKNGRVAVAFFGDGAVTRGTFHETTNMTSLSAAVVATMAIGGRASAADEIVIGYHGPMTGPASWVGLGGRDGALMALAEINTAGGINGRMIRMISYDDAGKASEAEAVAKKMIESDKVFAILGGGVSNVAIVVAEEAHRGKVPYMNGSAASPKVIDLQSRWTFSGATIDVRDIGENAAAFVGDYLKVKKIAVMNGADEFSQSLSDNVVRLIKERYGIETLTRQRYNPGETDFSSQLLAVRRSNPEYILMFGLYVEAARAVRTICKTRDDGMAILLVEQNANMALEVADFGYVLESGRIVMPGKAAQLLLDPRVQQAYLGREAARS